MNSSVFKANNHDVMQRTGYPHLCRPLVSIGLARVPCSLHRWLQRTHPCSRAGPLRGSPPLWDERDPVFHWVWARVIRIRGRHTTFQFALIPFGGYVQIEGLTRDRSTPSKGFVRDSSTMAMHTFPPWQRGMVMLAGPLANFALAIVTYSLLFGSSQAVTYDWRHEGTNVIRAVTGVAAAAGMKPYDAIESINGRTVRTFAEMKRIVGETAGNTLRVTIRRSPDGSPPR